MCWRVVLAGTVLLSILVSHQSLAQASGFVDTQTGRNVGRQTQSAGASGSCSSGSGSSSSGSSSGGGILGDLLGSFEGLLGPINNLLNQANCLRSSTVDRIKESIGDITDSVGSIQGTIDEAMGDLNLLDPDKFLQEVLGGIGGGGGQNSTELPVSQVNTVLENDTLRVVGNLANARSDSTSVLNQDAQASMQSQLSSLQEQVQGGAEQAQSSVELAEQATELAGGGEGGAGGVGSGTGTGTASTAQGIAAQSAQTAQQAQSRVSTQDAIKDLNTINSNISTQMGQLASQNGIQSQQLGQISTQNAIGLQLDAAQVGRLNQTVTGIAVANQTLADINEREQGDRQAEFIQRSAETNRLNMLNATGYRLAP